MNLRICDICDVSNVFVKGYVYKPCLSIAFTYMRICQ